MFSVRIIYYRYNCYHFIIIIIIIIIYLFIF